MIHVDPAKVIFTLLNTRQQRRNASESQEIAVSTVRVRIYHPSYPGLRRSEERVAASQLHRGASALQGRSISNRRVEADTPATDQVFVGGRKGQSRPCWGNIHIVANRRRYIGRLQRSARRRGACDGNCFISRAITVRHRITALYPLLSPGPSPVYASALIYRRTTSSRLRLRRRRMPSTSDEYETNTNTTTPTTDIGDQAR